MNAQTQCFGLVGGLGVAAGIAYYEALVAAHKRAGKPLKLVMTHAEVSYVFELARLGRLDALAEYLAKFLDDLRGAGATFAALPAVLPHICIKELAPKSPIPLVSMLDVVSQSVKSLGLTRVSLFGTRLSMESGLFGCLENVDLVRPKENELEYIHGAYSQLVLTGKGSRDIRDTLIGIADSLIRNEAVQAIVLAGTDFSLIFSPENTPFPAIDCAKIHIDAIARRL